MSKESEVAKYVRFMHSIGFTVLPLAGKRPIISAWQSVKHEDSLNLTLSKNPNNYGILTGKASNVVVIDIDKRNKGVEKWLEIIGDNIIEETFTVETGSGGYHIYYQYDNRLSHTRNNVYPGIDFRSEGGQVVGPGSKHPDTGKVYSVVYGYRRDIAVVAVMPEFLVDIFSK